MFSLCDEYFLSGGVRLPCTRCVRLPCTRCVLLFCLYLISHHVLLVVLYMYFVFLYRVHIYLFPVSRGVRLLCLLSICSSWSFSGRVHYYLFYIEHPQVFTPNFFILFFIKWLSIRSPTNSLLNLLTCSIIFSFMLTSSISFPLFFSLLVPTLEFSLCSIFYCACTNGPRMRSCIFPILGVSFQIAHLRMHNVYTHAQFELWLLLPPSYACAQ